MYKRALREFGGTAMSHKPEEIRPEPRNWTETPAELSARRQRLFKRRRMAMGLRKVAVWVPESRVHELRQFAARLVSGVT